MIKSGSTRRRRFGAFVAVPLVGALALAGCGGGDDGGDEGGGSEGGAANSFSFAIPASATGAPAPFQDIAEQYAEESGVEVEVISLPAEQYGVTLRTQLQGGNAPDAMVVAPGSGQDQAVLPLAEAGLLEPLGGESATVVTDDSRPLVTYEDQLYAQPTDLVAVGMIWNPNAASEAGVEFPEDSDALINSCAGLTNEGKSFFAVAGSAPPNVGLMAMSISAARVYGETPDWNEQRADGNVTFADTQGWTDTLQTVLDLNEGGCFQPGAAGGGFDAITNGIAQGTALGAFTPGGAAAELQRNVPGLTLEIRPFPPASGGDPFLFASPNYGIAIAAASDDPQKQAAQAFLDWLTEPENAAQLAEVAGNAPVVGIEEATLPPQYEQVKPLLVDGDYVPLPNNLWPNPAIYDALATGTQGLLAGQGDIQSVLESMDQAWDQ
jgi:raffinose/stachyose/melibiose transport system substrate-binding protein